MTLTGRELLVLLELHVIHDGQASGIDAVESEDTFTCVNITNLERLKLVTVGPANVDQSEEWSLP